MKELRQARRILQDGGFRPIELSELESELATLELYGGADRKARRLFLRSLKHPTDNSLAQIEWASHRLATLDVRLEDLDVPFASEARARSAAQQGNWTFALAEGLSWLDDQPFEAQAAAHSSFVAAVGLDDWGASMEIARLGLQANPTDLTLLNNMAYALIEMGELQKANEYLKRASGRVPDQLEESIALEATRGLFQFRTGNPAHGRHSYQIAIDMAHRHSQPEMQAMATAMHIREELAVDPESRTHTSPAMEALTRLRREVGNTGVIRCVDRTLRLLEGLGPSDRQP